MAGRPVSGNGTVINFPGPGADRRPAGEAPLVRAGGRLPWADLVRVQAIAAVVLLHCEAVPNTQFGAIPLATWWQTNVYNALVCICVPLFVMLSGALLLPRADRDGRTFLRQRAVRLLPPLLAWTLIYAAWYKFAWGRPLTTAGLADHLVAGIARPLFPHLWFLYLIVSLYLLLPLLRVYFRHAALPNQLWFLALWVVATGVKPLLAQRAGIDLGLYLDPVFGFVGYFLLGGTIVRFLPDRLERRAVAAAWIALLAGYGINLYGTYALSVAAGRLDDYFYEPIAPTVMAMSAAAFLLLRHYGSGAALAAGGRAAAALANLSPLAFGIYLSHALVIVLLESGALGFSLHATMAPPIVAAPLLATVVLVASAALTAALRRTPALRWLAP